MEMKCPFCIARDGLVATHRHMVSEHVDMVMTERDEETGKMQYSLQCPYCEESFMRQVNPRGRNPRFLEEFKAEIAMVAFDQIIYHVLQEHPMEVGVDPAELGLDLDQESDGAQKDGMKSNGHG